VLPVGAPFNSINDGRVPVTIAHVILLLNCFWRPQYNVVGRVRELGLLGATADAGILSKLEANGIDLVKLEQLLPAIEKLGLLEFAGSNQQFLVNLVAPLLIEPAPLLLPGVAALLAAGPSGFFALAAATGGIEVALIASNAELPLVGLPAGPVAGLLLVPLTVILGGAGAFLSGVKKA
jgi:hypothetical protein